MAGGTGLPLRARASRRKEMSRSPTNRIAVRFERTALPRNLRLNCLCLAAHCGRSRNRVRSKNSFAMLTSMLHDMYALDLR